MLVIDTKKVKADSARLKQGKKIRIIEINGTVWDLQTMRSTKPAPVNTPKPETRNTPPPPIQGADRLYVNAEIQRSQEEIKTNLLSSLEIEYNSVMKERKILSSQIWKMVENGASKEELATHYDRIESYRPTLQKLYDDKNHVKQYGKLPEVQETNQDPETIAGLKLKKRSLIDKRCKLKAKLAKKVSAPEKYVQWELELAQTEAMVIDVQNTIKQLEGKA